MKFIFRRAKETSHFMLCETKDGKVGYLMHFPALLLVWAICAIIGLDTVHEWWKPWSVIATALFLTYLVYVLRQPWEGEKLPLVQAAKLE